MAEVPPAKRQRMEGWDNLNYHAGFGGHFSSEALPNALPKGQNNPQKVGFFVQNFANNSSSSAPMVSMQNNYLVLHLLYHETRTNDRTWIETAFLVHYTKEL